MNPKKNPRMYLSDPRGYARCLAANTVAMTAKKPSLLADPKARFVQIPAPDTSV
jgi:hypothetical protein